MIELIFVIVILGILAAVAIPKLAATRDDARIASGASDIATAVSDFGARYTARGSWGPGGVPDDVSAITNVKFAEQVGNVPVAVNAGPLTYTSDGLAVDPGVNDCITLDITANAANDPLTDGNLTVISVNGVGGGNAICQGMTQALNDILNAQTDNVTGVHAFGGSSVVW